MGFLWYTGLGPWIYFLVLVLRPMLCALVALQPFSFLQILSGLFDYLKFHIPHQFLDILLDSIRVLSDWINHPLILFVFDFQNLLSWNVGGLAMAYEWHMALGPRSYRSCQHLQTRQDKTDKTWWDPKFEGLCLALGGCAGDCCWKKTNFCRLTNPAPSRSTPLSLQCHVFHLRWRSDERSEPYCLEHSAISSAFWKDMTDMIGEALVWCQSIPVVQVKDFLAMAKNTISLIDTSWQRWWWPTNHWHLYSISMSM